MFGLVQRLGHKHFLPISYHSALYNADIGRAAEWPIYRRAALLTLISYCPHLVFEQLHVTYAREEGFLTVEMKSLVNTKPKIDFHYPCSHRFFASIQRSLLSNLHFACINQNTTLVASKTCIAWYTLSWQFCSLFLSTLSVARLQACGVMNDKLERIVAYLL
jgi:hypothetical protein